MRWEEPLLEVQNGQIIGYNLTCYCVDPCATLSADLGATRNSTATNFTITLVSPLMITHYACSLSAINEVGEGPSTQCFFTTQEVGKTMPIGLGA